MQESAVQNGTILRIDARIDNKKHVRLCGDDFQMDDVLLPHGTVRPNFQLQRIAVDENDIATTLSERRGDLIVIVGGASLGSVMRYSLPAGATCIDW